MGGQQCHPCLKILSRQGASHKTLLSSAQDAATTHRGPLLPGCCVAFTLTAYVLAVAICPTLLAPAAAALSDPSTRLLVSLALVSTTCRTGQARDHTIRHVSCMNLNQDVWRWSARPEHSALHVLAGLLSAGQHHLQDRQNTCSYWHALQTTLCFKLHFVS